MRVQEAIDLPVAFLDWLARIMEEAEAGGEWPEPMCYAATALIPKAGGAPEDGRTKKRPITVASLWYRAYASIRYQELIS